MKYEVGAAVKINAPDLLSHGQVGTITSIRTGSPFPYYVSGLPAYSSPDFPFAEHQLELVQPDFGGHPRFKELIDEILRLHSAKNRDYTRGGNPLGNFSRVAATISSYGRPTTPAQTSFEYMMKQVDAGGRMLFQGYEGDTEGLTERLKDVAVYALLTIINKEEEGA